MKRFVFLVAFLFLAHLSFSQNGWRKGEMEIKFHLNSQKEADLLHELNLNAESASPDGSEMNVYVIPEELSRIHQSGFSYTITIPDMIKHYAHFWDAKVPSGYMTYEQIVALADSLSTNFPAICKKVLFGTSVGGRELGALKISDNADIDEPEAEILFDGGIHGDEVMGSEIVIRYARYLCLGYGTDSVYTDLVNNHEIWLYYMVNPDGRVNMSRYNNNGVDCNRDAGYMWNAEGNSTSAFSQIESKALRNCMLQTNPVVYTNYHGGTEIISYPWSYRPSAPTDWVQMNQLASVYSQYSGYTSLPYGQGFNIMYAINGSNKDFQYGSSGNVGWSIEITNDKQPPSSLISSYYNKNEPAITEVIKRCGYGAEGIVTDSITGEPVQAIIWINNYYPVLTKPGAGDYHKYLLPGTYTIKVTANGYQTKVINALVPATGSVTTDFSLIRQTGRYACQVMSCRIPATDFSTFTNSAYTPGALGATDNVYYSLWKNGWIVLDMGDTLFNGPGGDFKIMEGDTSAEGFTCYASLAKDGPWTQLGTGMGTTFFDLAAAYGGVMSKARYLKIVDDGDGPGTGNDLGFDLNSVEMITQPLIADFISSGKNPCAGTELSFMDFSAGTPTAWFWEFPGAIPATSTEQNPQHIIYQVPGPHDVSLKVTNAYCFSKKTRTAYLTVKEMPLVDLGVDTTVEASQALVLDAGNPGSVYLWSTGETTELILADSSGTGYGRTAFWVDVTHNAGCVGTDTIRVTFSFPTVIGMTKQPLVRVYPNPAVDLLNIEFTGRNVKIRLISPLGSVVFEKKTVTSGGHESIHVKDLPRGIYLLEISSEGKQETSKIIFK